MPHHFVQFYQVLHQLKLDGVFKSDVSVLISDDRYSSAKELCDILSKFAEITSQCQALSESQVANVLFWISRLQDHLLGFIGSNNPVAPGDLDYYYAASWDVYIGNSPVYWENPKCPGGPFLKDTYDDYFDEYAG